MARLTDISIRNAKPGPSDRLLSDGANLFLRVRPNGAKGWIVRLKRQGKRRVHTLGAWPDVPIKQARAQAAQIVAQEHGTASVTVRDAVEQYLDAMIRPRYRRVGNAEVYARRLQSALGSLSVDVVRPFDVSRMIDDYRREAPVAAVRCLGFVRGFFAWCVGFGYLERSPVTDVQTRAFGVVEVSRERTLTDVEIRDFWHAEDLPHRALLRFLLVTGLRIGEAQAAQASWVRADGWLDLPAHVMKNKRPHAVYVSPLAKSQIERAAAPHLFRCVSPTAVQSALRRWHVRHGHGEDCWSPHDLRRTFATRLGDLGVPPHVIAKAIGHTFTPSEALPTYLRSEWIDERKAAATKLAQHVARIVGKGR